MMNDEHDEDMLRKTTIKTNIDGWQVLRGWNREPYSDLDTEKTSDKKQTWTDDRF